MSICFFFWVLCSNFPCYSLFLLIMPERNNILKKWKIIEILGLNIISTLVQIRNKKGHRGRKLYALRKQRQSKASDKCWDNSCDTEISSQHMYNWGLNQNGPVETAEPPKVTPTKLSEEFEVIRNMSLALFYISIKI